MCRSHEISGNDWCDQILICAATRNAGSLDAFMTALLEVVQHVVASAHGKGDDWHGRGFVCGAGKDAGITNI